jgi:uncharacterized protein involved in response to NO
LSAEIGWLAAAAFDGAFLLMIAATATREIVAAKNWRNLKVVALLGLLSAVNLAFHVEAHFEGLALYATRFGIAVVIMLIMVVVGRIVPSFTRNWLMRRGPGRLPAPFGWFDLVNLALSGTQPCTLDFRAPRSGSRHRTDRGRRSQCRAACVLGRRPHFCRPARVHSPCRLRLRATRILLSGLAAFDILEPSVGIQAWTVGAIGLMALAVMTRASLGHTGRPLVASLPLQVVCAAILVAALRP